MLGLTILALVSARKGLAGQLKTVHETIGTIGYFRIGAHALAARHHHVVSRENTLVQMLPGR